MVSQSDMENIDTESYERYQIDNDNHTKYYERYQIGERK